MRNPEIDVVYECLRSGDVAGAKERLSNPSLLAKIDPLGFGSWLHIAAILSDEPSLYEWLISMGQLVNKLCSLKSTPLGRSLAKGHLRGSRILLEHGAKTDLDRCILSAIQSGPDKALASIKLLEEFGADLHKVYLNDFTNQPMNALTFAKGYGYQDFVDYLRSIGVTEPEPVETLQQSEVERFFEQQFGFVEPRSLIEIVPTEPVIAVRAIVESLEKEEPVTLFTSGMSAKPMRAPAGHDDYRYAELFIQLPNDWRYDDLEDRSSFWPVLWLRRCAKLPHHQDAWLGGPACVISSEDPSRPLAPNTELSCVLLLSEKHFIRLDGSPVRLYRMVPLYPEERQFEMDHGTTALMQALDNAGVSMVVDLNRPRAV